MKVANNNESRVRIRMMRLTSAVTNQSHQLSVDSQNEIDWSALFDAAHAIQQTIGKVLQQLLVALRRNLNPAAQSIQLSQLDR